MNCPVCKKVQLVRTKYEDTPVRKCTQCSGYLVQRKRVGAIKNSRQKSDEDFLTEIASSADSDTQKSIHCPGCLSRMSKKKESVGSERYWLDECLKCDWAWFDAGELAKLQLHYESSEQALELFRFQDRLESMTEDERKEYEARIAALPDPKLFDRDDFAQIAYLSWRRSWHIL